LKINPKIKLMATPWSAPTWMKTNQNSKGGSLKPEFYTVYAAYFVKYIEAMKAQGIPIDAITIQNEPENPNNNPSMVMKATEQAAFIKNHLGPAFKTNNIATKIVIFDHNCDNPGYPTAILDDKDAKAFVDGSAFHLYAGNINALSTVRNAHPDKNVYFTEQFTSSKGDFGGDLGWHMRNVIVGATRNWAKVVLEWNLANNLSMGPYTPGGCTECLGALTVGTDYTRNVSYYIVAHLSKFVPAGSIRIKSGTVNNLQNVAFRTPAGKKVLLVYNENAAAQTFNINFNGKIAPVILQGNSAGTFVW
jgi:glucosylceramidase